MITVKIQNEKLTIKQLKKIISKNYPGYPPVSKQKIVYKMKVLQNEDLLASLINSDEPQETYNLTLIASRSDIQLLNNKPLIVNNNESTPMKTPTLDFIESNETNSHKEEGPEPPRTSPKENKDDHKGAIPVQNIQVVHDENDQMPDVRDLLNADLGMNFFMNNNNNEPNDQNEVVLGFNGNPNFISLAIFCGLVVFLFKSSLGSFTDTYYSFVSSYLPSSIPKENVFLATGIILIFSLLVLLKFIRTADSKKDAVDYAWNNVLGDIFLVLYYFVVTIYPNHRGPELYKKRENPIYEQNVKAADNPQNNRPEEEPLFE